MALPSLAYVSSKGIKRSEAMTHQGHGFALLVLW